MTKYNPFDDLQPRISDLLTANHPAQIIIDALQEDTTSRDGENMWLYTSVCASELAKAIDNHQPNAHQQVAAKALNKLIREISPQHIAIVYEHFAIISNIATLVENGQSSAAKFLIQHHDINPDTPLIKAALDNLANSRTRAAIQKYASAYQQSQNM